MWLFTSWILSWRDSLLAYFSLCLVCCVTQYYSFHLVISGRELIPVFSCLSVYYFTCVHKYILSLYNTKWSSEMFSRVGRSLIQSPSKSMIFGMFLCFCSLICRTWNRFFGTKYTVVWFELHWLRIGSASKAISWRHGRFCQELGYWDP